MQTFVIPVSWTVAAHMEIEADTIGEAIEKAFAANLPDKGEYVTDSFEVSEKSITVK